MEAHHIFLAVLAAGAVVYNADLLKGAVAGIVLVALWGWWR